ncbi:MAG TPA: deaminase domain-containing protein, partial [Clostridium sp.]
NKYMKVDEKEKTTFKIDQSKALQDSINIAVAIYDNKEFKAISGSNNITNYCTAPSLEEAIFKSSKVNKLGKLGVGYDRVNDSEKKIFEEIHKQIEAKVLKNEGNLILYSKWEPCPSCYFVISQFCKKHPNIKVQVKYGEKYGELDLKYRR